MQDQRDVPAGVRITEDAESIEICVRVPRDRAKTLPLGLGVFVFWSGALSAFALCPPGETESRSEAIALAFYGAVLFSIGAMLLWRAVFNRTGFGGLVRRDDVVEYRWGLGGRVLRRTIVSIRDVVGVVYTPPTRMTVSAGPWPILRAACVNVQLRKGLLRVFDGLSQSSQELEWISVRLKEVIDPG